MNNKPLTMIIKETKLKLASVCNESGLSPAILDLIVQGIYSEVHSLAEKQALEEQMSYMQTIKDIESEDVNKNKGDCHESEKENGNE